MHHPGEETRTSFFSMIKPLRVTQDNYNRDRGLFLEAAYLKLQKVKQLKPVVKNMDFNTEHLVSFFIIFFKKTSRNVGAINPGGLNHEADTFIGQSQSGSCAGNCSGS
jgi:hypothetical protein